mgnify:CR=1 FL=1
MLSKKEIEENLKKCLKKTFSNFKIKKKINLLKIGSLKEWDSLGNFNLLLEVEKVFNVRFKPSELENITSINQIINFLIKKKIKNIKK